MDDHIVQSVLRVKTIIFATYESKLQKSNPVLKCADNNFCCIRKVPYKNHDQNCLTKEFFILKHDKTF